MVVRDEVGGGVKTLPAADMISQTQNKEKYIKETEETNNEIMKQKGKKTSNKNPVLCNAKMKALVSVSNLSTA